LPQPSGKDFQLLMQRILDGYKKQNNEACALLTKIHDTYAIEVRSKEQQLRELTKEFNDYRGKNDLDRYFSTNLSDESRERVLKNIEYLLQVTDWHYFDPSATMTLEASNVQSFLQQVIHENDNLQRKRV